jgi:hypothetical protein
VGCRFARAVPIAWVNAALISGVGAETRGEQAAKIMANRPRSRRHALSEDEG